MKHASQFIRETFILGHVHRYFFDEIVPVTKQQKAKNKT